MALHCSISQSVVAAGIAVSLACADSTEPTPPADSWATAMFGAEVQWAVTDPASSVGMAMDESNLFAVGTALLAIDRVTGEVKWRVSEQAPGGSLAVAHGVVGLMDGATLRLFQSATGQELPHPQVRVNGLASDGARFYASIDEDTLAAIDASDGDILWKTSLAPNNPAYTTRASGITVAGDDVFVAMTYRTPTWPAGRDTAIMARVDRLTGNVRWRVALPDTLPNPISFYWPPVGADGMVIGAVDGQHLYALDIPGGHIVWQANPHTENGGNGLAVCSNIVAVSVGTGVAGLNLSDGSERWTETYDDQGSSLNVGCSFGTVLVVGSGGPAYLHDALTGAIRAKYPDARPPRDAVLYIPTATRDDKALYLGSAQGFVKISAP